MILDEKRCRRVIGELPRRKYTTNKIINRERLTMDDTFYMTMVVLSFLPLCKCGVTARLLVEDIFGIEKPNPRIEALIVRYTRRISEVFKIPVAEEKFDKQDTYRETGVGGFLQMWVDKKYKDLTYRIVNLVLEEESRNGNN